MRRKFLWVTLCVLFGIAAVSSAFWWYSISRGPDITTLSIADIIKDEKLLKKVFKRKGVAYAMQRLVEESKGGSLFDCHQQAHTIGRLGYEVVREKAFQACDASCHSGCYHGAMESFLNQEGIQDLAGNIERICRAFDTNFGVFECLHGVGHGILAYLDYDLPEALNECRELKDSFAHSSCFGGVFMENILTGQGLGASLSNHETPWLNKTDPYFPCNAIDKDPSVQYECYQMQTSWMLTINQYDFAKVAELCLRAPEEFIPVCFKSFGRDAAGHTLRNSEKIRDLCSKVPRTKDYYIQCVIGATNVIVDFWGPGLKDQVTQLCMLLPEDGKKICYATLSGRLADVFRTDKERAAVCFSFEKEYQYLCSS